jgi:hypothetical protein
MVRALICSAADVESELGHTALWRLGMERRTARTVDEARSVISSQHPQLLVLDRDVDGAEGLIAALRAEAATRQMSIVVMARTDFEPSEISLLEAGANAILRLPAGRDWDDRLMRLVDVPTRKDSRFSVFFKVETTHGGSGEQAAIMATALNLSVSGILLETAEPLTVGEELQMQFRIPDVNELVKAHARIVRLAGNRRFGLEFVELTAAGAESIRRYVEGAS